MGTDREQGMACALANSFAFQEHAQQLGALQAGTVYLRNREKQVSQANGTGQGRRHGVKGEA